MKQFQDEFYRIKNLIVDSESFVFARYGDGEVMLIEHTPVGKNSQAYLVDGWSSNGFTKLGDHLSLTLKNKDWFYGIPCQCCNLSCKNYLLGRLEVPDNQITYANLFVNSNYEHFKKWINDSKLNVVLIANFRAQENLNLFPFNILEFYPVGDDCVQYYEQKNQSLVHDLTLLSNKFTNTIFFVSAGPLSEIIIDILYRSNKKNKYVDVGSALDEYIHNKKTRPYMSQNSFYNKLICQF